MSSKPQVTITLGRSGQVVKRPGPNSVGTHTNYMPPSGGKRPITERLGNNSENYHFYGSQSGNKRQRSENGSWSSRDDVNDDSRHTSRRRVGRDDLRLKLMHKSLSRRTNIDADVQSQVDLREKLSRTTQIPLRFDAQQGRSEPRASNLVRRIPPTRSEDDSSQMDSLRKSYSAWTLDGLRYRSPDGLRRRSPDGLRRRSPEGLRRRSPDRILGASRGFSPSRTDEMRRVPSMRPVDPSRPGPFVTKGVIDASRSAPLMTKTMAPVGAPKPIVRLPPPNGIMPKSSYMAEEPLTVGSLLQSLGLGKYSILFQAEEVDMTALKQMGDNDLKELGIPMGPRKKILLAVLPRAAKRQS